MPSASDYNGKIFAVFKPRGISSFEAVKRIREALGVKKVGHAGTLDPLASGVLIVGVGRQATKQLSRFFNAEKEYVATIKLGETTATLDAEGEKKAVEVKKKPSRKKILEALKEFEGEILQVPPAFSAVKVKGVRAYKLARNGKEVKLKPRKVQIKKIGLLHFQYPFLKLRVVTGKGVYIRALARDIGEKLGIYAYLARLQRTRVGEFTLQQAVSLNKIQSQNTG